MNFDRTILPGGVRVLTDPMPELRSATIGFWVGVGSRDEPPQIQGASHFLEHLLFKGTQRRSAQQIAEEFDAVGGEANAFSAKEYTCFFGRVLDEDLPMAADVLLDMLTSPLIQPEDVDGERNVILEEIAMHEDTPEDLVHDIFLEHLFGPHPLAREVMGTVQSVKEVEAIALRDFHSKYYHPRNIVVAAAGNVDHDALVGWVEQAFPADEKEPNRREPSQPVSAGNLRVVERLTEQAHVVIGGLGYSRSHPKRFAWGVLDNLLGGGMSSRLFQEIRERRGLAYSVYSYRNTYSETGAYAVYAGTAPANTKQVLGLIVDELDRLLDSGVTEDELVRAKGHMRGGIVLSLEDPSSRMTRLGKSELVQDEILTLDEMLAAIDAVTLEDVADVAAELLPREHRVLTVVGPFKEGDLADWV